MVNGPLPVPGSNILGENGSKCMRLLRMLVERCDSALSCTDDGGSPPSRGTSHVPPVKEELGHPGSTLSGVIVPMADNSHQKREREDFAEGNFALNMGKIGHPSIDCMLGGVVTTACKPFFTKKSDQRE